MKLVCPKCHISRSIKNIRREYNIQPEFFEGEIDHNLINIDIYKDYEKLWRHYLVDDLLGLPYVVARHGYIIQKITGVSYKNSLTEASLGWSCLGRYSKEANRFYKHQKKNRYVRDFIRKTIHGGGYLACKKNCINIIQRSFKFFREILWG